MHSLTPRSRMPPRASWLALPLDHLVELRRALRRMTVCSRISWRAGRRTPTPTAPLPTCPACQAAMERKRTGSRRSPVQRRLIGAWLHSGRASTVTLSTGRSVDLADILVRGITAGTDRNAPSYWGDIRDLDQRIVEASDIALTLWLTRDVVWSRLAPAARQNALAWLDQVNDKRLPDNNWHLFVTFVNAVDATLGGPDRRASSLANYSRFKSFYRGDGWFSDGTGERVRLLQRVGHSLSVVLAQ